MSILTALCYAGGVVRQACGVTLHAISQNASDHLKRHGSLAVPLAFFAMHEEKTEGKSFDFV